LEVSTGHLGAGEDFRKALKTKGDCWCREGELNPQGTKYRRILRASKWTTFHCFELLLSASDAVSSNIELPPIPFQMWPLRPSSVTTASQELLDL